MVAKTKGSDMGDGLAGLCFNSALVVSGGDAAQRAARQAGLRELERCIRSIRKPWDESLPRASKLLSPRPS